ncbi:response regulator [Desertivirga brevis]|uniref:response regulator n=1 Tax=Desertivirga brevis TaxID=2810310 RepID=UPI001A96D27B|nr:response regulator [Pedobacter sp. SYSU D00873]
MAKRILALDDDPDILDIYSMAFGAEGYEVKTLLSPDNLAGAIVDFSPDLMLLDIKIGAFNGLEMCKVLKQSSITRDIPIVIVSGLDCINRAVEEYAADAVISKPFDLITLVNTVDRFLLAKVVPLGRVVLED